MRRNKTLSSFSIAAIALLAAAVPGLAQAQSSGSRAEEKSRVPALGSGLQLAFNRNSGPTFPRAGISFVEPKSLVDTAPVASSTLSPAAFKTTSRFTTTERKFSFDSQFNWYQAPSSSKAQFRTDDERGARRSNWSVSFVPSRGPKFPW